MTADYIIKILNSCEALNGFEINSDYSDKENNSVCAAPSGKEGTSRLYCDGSGIYFKDFELAFRIAGGKLQAAKNRLRFEKLSDELCGFGKAHAFPEVQGFKEPVQISVIRDAAVSADELHSIVYKMEIRIYYFKKNRT